MRVILMNTYPMDKTYQDWKEGKTPSHHLWGKIELERRGRVEMEILRFEKYRLLNSIGRFLKIEFLDQQFRTLLNIRKYDIIYAPNGSGTTKLLVILKLLRLLSTPIVIVAHQPQFVAPEQKNRLKINIAKILMLQFDAMVFFSHRMKADTKINYNIPQAESDKKFLHLDWGADNNFYNKFANLTPVKETRYAISAGTTLRDIDTLIEAFREVNFQLRIFTTPFLLPTIKDIPENVTIYSEGTTYKDLLEEYNNARIILVPLKISENPNNTHGLTSLMDVMVMGKPVIITRNKNLDIDVEKEGIGFWANRYDPMHWRKLLNEIIFDENRLEEMGRKSLALYHNKYNAERFAEGLENIFMKVCSK
jgi:glycosyltransferase involved in cell wall biosynthesis